MSYRREYSKRNPAEKNSYWCVNCQCWVKVKEMRYGRTDDDWVEDRTCPGCDLTLIQTVYDPDEDV